jgi:G6PDH family F420-dependent oxidoreductase
MKIGYSLSAEQFTPAQLLKQARLARDSGFTSLAISDHFHPWNEAQGNSAFVWSMIGALSQVAPTLPISTMVTCPIVRINPVILAQAAATASVLLENLNEHVWGAPWPSAEERLDRLREAVHLMRLLWSGENVDFDGHYFRAVNARIYTLPAEPPPIYVSGLAPQTTDLAVEIGNGLVTFDPEMLTRYRDRGGEGTSQTALKVCYDLSESEAIGTMHQMWSVELNPGQLNRELSQTSHIESAATLVTPEMVAEKFTCGGDPDRHIAAIQQRVDEGFDEIFVQQVGADMEGFFKLYGSKVLPSFESMGS